MTQTNPSADAWLKTVHRKLSSLSPQAWQLTFWVCTTLSVLAQIVVLFLAGLHEVVFVAAVSGGLLAILAIAMAIARVSVFGLWTLAAALVFWASILNQDWNYAVLMLGIVLGPVLGATALTLRNLWARQSVALLAYVPLAIGALVLQSEAVRVVPSTRVLFTVLGFGWLVPWFLAFYVPSGAFPERTLALRRFPWLVWSLSLFLACWVIHSAFTKPPARVPQGVRGLARQHIFPPPQLSSAGRCYTLAEANHRVCDRLRGEGRIAIYRGATPVWRRELLQDARLVEVIGNRALIEAHTDRNVVSFRLIDLDPRTGAVRETEVTSTTDPSTRCVLSSTTTLLCSRRSNQNTSTVWLHWVNPSEFDQGRRQSLGSILAGLVTTVHSAVPGDRSTSIEVSDMMFLSRARLMEQSDGAWIHFEEDRNVLSIPVSIGRNRLKDRRGSWQQRLSAVGPFGLSATALVNVFGIWLALRPLYARRLRVPTIEPVADEVRTKFYFRTLIASAISAVLMLALVAYFVAS